jgi:hypothetical protein
MDPQSAENENPLRTEQAVEPPTKASSDTSPSQKLQTTAQQLTDHALTFLSNASNETLGACLVGLGATTYLVLGRVGLVLMGVVGGVVLHATWEGHTQEAPKSAEEKRRKEIGLDVVHRVLDWRTQQKETPEDVDDDAASLQVDIYSKKALDFTGFQPETEVALNELTDAVIRDYVKFVLRFPREVLLLTDDVDGGTRQYYPPRCSSRIHVDVHWSPSSFQSPATFHENDRPTPSSISSQTHLPSSSYSSTSWLPRQAHHPVQIAPKPCKHTSSRSQTATLHMFWTPNISKRSWIW